MTITDRKTVDCESDYCIEWEDGTFLWIKDNRIVDSNDMLEDFKVNEVLEYICKPLEEIKWMYEELE